jgi:hypothetical protein
LEQAVGLVTNVCLMLATRDELAAQAGRKRDSETGA